MKDKPFLALVIIWLLVAMVVIGVKMLIVPHLNIEKPPVQIVSENPDERCVVTYTEGTDSAGAISEYDATGDYIFFSYSERTAVVDAYDFDGNFAFRLHFENKENGALSIRCQDDLLYVSSKYHNVFVFDGDTLIRQMTYQEAREEGFKGSFFSERSKTVTQRWGRFYRLNEDGSLGSAIKLPVVVSVDYYKYVVPFVLIPVLWIGIAVRDGRKKRNVTTV